MTPLQAAAVNYLRTVPAAQAHEIAAHIRRADTAPAFNLPALYAALHGLDDAGQVLMRGGWYRLSEAAKAGAA